MRGFCEHTSPDHYNHIAPYRIMMNRMNIVYCFILLVESTNAFSTLQSRRAAPLASCSLRTTRPARPARPALYATNEGTSEENEKETSLTSQIASQLEATRVGRNVLIPLAKVLDDLTGGWALTYADLAPETPASPVVLGFLVTNLAYTICWYPVAMCYWES